MESRRHPRWPWLEVFEDGSFYAHERIVTYLSRRGNRVERPIKAKAIRGGVNNEGYIRVTIGGRKYFAHRLVYETFNGEIPPGLTVNHLNLDKADNRVSNLEICTIAENVKHAQANGHVKGPGRYGRHVQRDSRDNLKKPYFVFMRNPVTGLSFSGGYFVSVAEAQGRADAIIVINEWDREPHFMPLNLCPRAR